MNSRERREINEAKGLFERLVLSFGMRQQPRFTQDAPIRSAAWTAHANDPREPVQLILVPNQHHATRDTVELLIARLADREITPEECGLLALPTSIRVALSFADLLCAVVPITAWWDDSIIGTAEEFIAAVGAVLDGGSYADLVGRFRAHPKKGHWRLFAVAALIGASPRAQADPDARASVDALQQWRFIGRMADILIHLGDEPEPGAVGYPIEEDSLISEEDRLDFAENCMKPGIAFLDRIGEDIARLGALTKERMGDDARHDGDGIWSINLNRPVEIAVARSRMSVKADAAITVFGDETRDITWAVVDSGVDASHVAFARAGSNEEAAPTKPASPANDDKPKKLAGDDGSAGDKASMNRGRTASASRIKATYDFNRLQFLLRNDYEPLVSEDDRKLIATTKKWKKNTAQSAKNDAILEFLFARHRVRGRPDPSRAAVAKALEDREFRGEVARYVEVLKTNLVTGRMIDWAVVEPLIAVPHDDDYPPPVNGHGTHVAGILIGNVAAGSLGPGHPKQPVTGICPQMSIYDLRVCDDAGRGDEFIVQAALQFITHLNRNRDMIQVHGVNISLSIRHDVANYACGQTPVCIDCERLIGDGVVVVAAAGNKGFQKLSTESGSIDAYNAISITDPGNAQGVITVGATHRSEPHTYGVSYFSSRGPTGDGREKPDLVAPGEKIEAPVPGNRLEVMDGTSMAAPHVSGAAAMLMARHRELAGRPQRIKEILCATATDLGRRREFQGAGMVDILRALQSV